MSAFHIPPDRLEDLVTTLIANALAQYPSRPAVIARPSKNVGSSSLLDSQSPSVLKTLHEDFAVLHRSSSQANHKGTSSKASSHDEQIVQSQGLRSAVAESDVGYTGARRSTPPSSFAQEQTTPVDSKTPLTDTPFGVLPNDPSPTIGHVQGAAVVKAKGNGLKPVSGQCSTSSEPPSRRLSEIPDGHSSSSTDGPAPLDEQQHRRLAEAPPLSRTSDSTSSHSSKRLTAAAFFTPDSTPEYEGSSAGSTSFSDQDLTELLEEEKSKATATGKGTEEPNNHAESQDESAPETKTAAADISTGPHTDHKAKQNEKKLDRECRKAYEARKPPSGVKAPRTRAASKGTEAAAERTTLGSKDRPQRLPPTHEVAARVSLTKAYEG
ncbi:MAG: hypothetical protein LQ338_006323 [Usnochroma carphineum]|nr:MAG: hypothetical protein LQ338_006323 [Usnochroma carphineum]